MTKLNTRLEQALNGLTFPSETDAPLQVFVWPENESFEPEVLRQHAGHDAATPVHTTDLDRLLRPATTARDWHGPQEQERVRRFTALRDLLRAELDDVTVFKIGDAAMDVFVVGRDADGQYLGFSTHVVET